MRTLRIAILLLIVFMWGMILSGLAKADTHTAASCSQANVQTAIDASARGDTVAIPAGSCTWATTYSHSTYIKYGVRTTKAIKIQGAGIDTTKITANLTIPSGTYLGSFAILYVPSSASDDADTIFEVSGITFDDSHGTAVHGGAIMVESQSATRLNKVTIHTNKFLNCYGGEASSTDHTGVIVFEGTISGVVYSNSFYGFPYFKIKGYDDDGGDLGGRAAWNSTTYSMGSPKAMYFEDNLLYKNADGITDHTTWSSDSGATYVARYNTFTNTYDDINSLFNMHSIQRGGTPSVPTYYNYATMAGEFYGNSIVNSNRGTYILNQGGGRALVFYNYITNGTGSAKTIVSDTISDSYALTDNACAATANYPYPLSACSSDGERQRVSKSYYFNNRKSSNNGFADILQLYSSTWTAWGGNQIAQDLHYWKDGGVVNNYLTSGVACGTALPLGCASGTAFWKTAQSCTDLTGLVGASPATPLSGTLYRCYPASTWSVYYTPYEYPHPLRDDAPADTVAPSMTAPCAGSGTCTTPIVQIACDDVDDTEDILLGITATDASQATTVCYYDMETRADYTAMAADGHALTASGTSYTATAAGLACASSHTFWYACTDGTNETSVASTPFVIAGRLDDTAAVITSATTSSQACAVQQRINITTDKPSSCKWALSDKTYANMDYTFSVTGGETGHVAHSTDVSQDCSESVTRYIRCSTTQGVANTTSTSVIITTDAGKTVSIGSGGLTLGIGTGSNTITVIP